MTINNYIDSNELKNEIKNIIKTNPNNYRVIIRDTCPEIFDKIN